MFVQTTEPDKKKGIWLQTNNTLEKLIFDEEVFISGEWSDAGSYNNIPNTNYYALPCQGAAIGTNAYLFFWDGSSYFTYKYESVTDSYTRLSDHPSTSTRGTAVSVGTDIYLLGSNSGNQNQNCKYDTLTDTYTQMSNIPKSFYEQPAVAIGTNIYLFRQNSFGNNAIITIYKYDTLTDTYTELFTTASTGQGCENNAIAAVGNYIYLFSCSANSSNTRVYKYDIVNNSFTQIQSYSCYLYGARAVTVGTDIYVLGSVYGTKNYNLKFNTLDNTFTVMASIPKQFNSCPAVLLGDKIYLFVSSQDYGLVQVYSLESKTYQQDNLVVISQGKYKTVGYEIELFSNKNMLTQPVAPFADAWFYTLNDGLITNIPTYYGNGTQWIKIKN